MTECPPFSLLFRFRVLLSMQTKEQKQGRPGSEATLSPLSPVIV